MRCLWIGRELPFPEDSGDRIYSAGLARGLSDAGATVRFLGHAPAGVELRSAPRSAGITWTAVTQGKRGRVGSLLRSLPAGAASLGTREYSDLFSQQLASAERWDAVILDGYQSGWALAAAQEWRRRTGGAIVSISHNHESRVWREMRTKGQFTGPKAFLVNLNSRRVDALERRLLEQSDLVTAITEEDAAVFSTMTARPAITLKPGYDGARRAHRMLTPSTPREVLLIGSFGWVVKQENLRQFLAVADQRFAANGIRLHVVGGIPGALRQQLESKLLATTLHGFVKDPSELMARTRVGVVPEVIGGGFKLKFLDYFFSRIPVASLEGAAAGLSERLRAHVELAPDLPSLVDAIIRLAADEERLNVIQSRAYDIASLEFSWESSGANFAEHLKRLVARREPSFGTAAHVRVHT